MLQRGLIKRVVSDASRTFEIREVDEAAAADAASETATEKKEK